MSNSDVYKRQKRDIVICAGDFGGVWFGDGRDEAALDWLESLPLDVYKRQERYPLRPGQPWQAVPAMIPSAHNDTPVRLSLIHI